MNCLTVLGETEGGLPLWLDELLRPERIGSLIPVIAIVGGLSLAAIILIIRHRERMAKLQHGIDPDAKDDGK
jgi:hypothetical protein